MGAGGERAELVERLEAQDYPVIDMTDNEMAKLHVRHLVGGRGPGAGEEQLFRFEFPERPGALMNFLSVLGTKWNISLFHYRNHGAAWEGCWSASRPDRKSCALCVMRWRDGLPILEETANPATRFLVEPRSSYV